MNVGTEALPEANRRQLMYSNTHESEILKKKEISRNKRTDKKDVMDGILKEITNYSTIKVDSNERMKK